MVKIKRAASALFFLFFSCSKPCPEWIHNTVHTHCPEFNSSKYTSKAKNPFRNFEVEIIETQSGTRMYLNIYSLPLPPNPVITVEIGENITESTPIVMEGGQRMLLDFNITAEILTALTSGSEVTLSSGRYITTLKDFDFLVCKNISGVR